MNWGGGEKDGGVGMKPPPKNIKHENTANTIPENNLKTAKLTTYF